MMIWSILTIPIKEEQDVVVARQRARQIAGLLEFDVQGQSHICHIRFRNRAQRF